MAAPPPQQQHAAAASANADKFTGRIRAQQHENGKHGKAGSRERSNEPARPSQDRHGRSSRERHSKASQSPAPRSAPARPAPSPVRGNQKRPRQDHQHNHVADQVQPPQGPSAIKTGQHVKSEHDAMPEQSTGGAHDTADGAAQHARKPTQAAPPVQVKEEPGAAASPSRARGSGHHLRHDAQGQPRAGCTGSSSCSSSGRASSQSDSAAAGRAADLRCLQDVSSDAPNCHQQSWANVSAAGSQAERRTHCRSTQITQRWPLQPAASDGSAARLRGSGPPRHDAPGSAPRHPAPGPDLRVQRPQDLRAHGVDLRNAARSGANADARPATDLRHAHAAQPGKVRAASGDKGSGGHGFLHQVSGEVQGRPKPGSSNPVADGAGGGGGFVRALNGSAGAGRARVQFSLSDGPPPAFPALKPAAAAGRNATAAAQGGSIAQRLSAVPAGAARPSATAPQLAGEEELSDADTPVWSERDSGTPSGDGAGPVAAASVPGTHSASKHQPGVPLTAGPRCDASAFPLHAPTAALWALSCCCLLHMSGTACSVHP